MRKKNGFTLIELMIVVAIIAIIAAIAIPNLLAARLAANEASAISTLRNITSAQLQFAAIARCDVDKDGTGEFGMFRELSGTFAVRGAPDGTGGTTTLNPPVLGGAFRTMNGNGEVSRSGYFFKVFLPAVGEAVAEQAGVGAFTGSVDSDMAETNWCCYAWPADFGYSGNRTFFVNQAGDVTSTELASYNGTGAFKPETAGRAFKEPGQMDQILGVQAIGTKGRDGQIWKQVN